MRLYTRQLVAFAPEPGPAGARVVPDLATAAGRTTERRPDLDLHPAPRPSLAGRADPLTSADVKYGIERLFASDLITGGPNWAVQLLDDKTTPYDGPYADRRGLKSIATPDARTIRFTLTRPFADWDQVLALPAASPVEQRADTGAKYGDKPLSSGPYQIAAVADNGTITFVRNRYWSKATDPVRTALPDKVVLQTDVIPAERDRRVLSGAADADVSRQRPAAGRGGEGARRPRAHRPHRRPEHRHGPVRRDAVRGRRGQRRALPPRRAVRAGQGGGQGRPRRAVRGLAGDNAVATGAARLPGHRPLPGGRRQPRRPRRGQARARALRQAGRASRRRSAR